MLDKATRTNPRLDRFFAAAQARGAVQPPVELVPKEHFAGTDLSTNTFSFYGETYTLPDDFDWNHNPGKQHWAHDLNRFGFLVMLDPARPDEIERMQALILKWIARYEHADHRRSWYPWQNLLNIAVRIENWRRFLHRADALGLLTLSPHDLRIIHRSMFSQFRVLMRRILLNGFDTNWAMIGLRSALYMIYSNPGLPMRRRYERICWRFVAVAVKAQILPDGVHQELSPHYHWVTLELLTSMHAMSTEAASREGDALRPVLARMRRLLRALLLPGGGIVSLGDSDFDYGPRIANFIARPEYAVDDGVLGDLETFDHAGLAIYRDAQTSSVLVFDAGPFGTQHQHEDKLTFWLTAHGQPIVVDPGRYLYERGEATFYAYLRSTHAHSTLLIDGLDQNARAHPSAWRAPHALKPFAWLESDAFRTIGTYSLGYGPDCIPIVHERSILHTRGSGTWTIVDVVTGEDDHEVEFRLQLYPCKWRLERGWLWGELAAVTFRVEFQADAWDSWRVAEGQQSPKAGWWSPGLNKLEPAPMLLLSRRATLPLRSEVRIVTSAEFDRGCV